MVAIPQMAPETTTQEIASKSLDIAFCLVFCKSNTKFRTNNLYTKSKKHAVG